mmetsp:Transcript_3805/g.9632  ORF Transcript_3805/g.9632 Transcript_3805/m.9632 type:complete len:203 (+) Transcript_3805:79-687(+)
MDLIQARNDRYFAAGASPDWMPRVFVLSSFFWSKLGTTESGFDYQAVRRWGRWAKKPGLLQRDHILIPINHNNIHWFLVVLSPTLGTIHFYDSSPGGPGDKVLIARRLLQWYLCEARSTPGHPVIPADRWRAALRMPGTCLQGDMSSCGVYTAMHAERLSMGIQAKDFGFSQPDIQRLRRGLLCCLVEERLDDYGLLAEMSV